MGKETKTQDETRIVVLLAVENEVLLCRTHLISTEWTDLGTIYRKESPNDKPNLIARKLFRKSLGPMSHMLDVLEGDRIKVYRFADKTLRWKAYIWHVQGLPLLASSMFKASFNFWHSHGVHTLWVPYQSMSLASLNLATRWAILNLRAIQSSTSSLRARLRRDTKVAGASASSTTGASAATGASAVAATSGTACSAKLASTAVLNVSVDD